MRSLSEKILIFSIFSQKRAQNPGMVIVSILSQRSRKNHKNRKYHDIYRRYISANPADSRADVQNKSRESREQRGLCQVPYER